MVRGNEEIPGEKVIHEIQYFAIFSALKRLLDQGILTPEICRKANVAVAEKYGVLQLNV